MKACAHVPQLHHLNLRSCRMISDGAIHIVSHGMRTLYTLDISFCPKVTISSVCLLLRLRGDTMAELSLRQCHSIYLSLIAAGNREDEQVDAVRSHNEEEMALPCDDIVCSLESHGRRCSLSVLDMRYECGITSTRAGELLIAEDLLSLGFCQGPVGYFHRPAIWNQSVARRLISQSLS